jgi:hypothetical protein
MTRDSLTRSSLKKASIKLALLAGPGESPRARARGLPVIMSWRKLADAGVAPVPDGPPPEFHEFAEVFGGMPQVGVAHKRRKPRIRGVVARDAAATPALDAASTERAHASDGSTVVGPGLESAAPKRSTRAVNPRPQGHGGGGPKTAGGNLPGARSFDGIDSMCTVLNLIKVTMNLVSRSSGACARRCAPGPLSLAVELVNHVNSGSHVRRTVSQVYFVIVFVFVSKPE